MRSALSLLAGAAGLLASAGMASAAPVVTLFNNYDATFTIRCGGTACEQAVPEIRNGDNGQTAGAVEWNNGPTTAAPTSTANVTGTPGIWNGTAYGFSLTYVAATDLLTLNVNLGFVAAGAVPVSYVVNLAPTESMFIRAIARTGQPTTAFTNLVLNGNALGAFSGDDTADYLRITNFNWDQNWSLTGNLAMTGANNSPQSRPSVQFKLTNLDPPTLVPAPAALALFGIGLLGLGLLRRRD